MLLSAAVSSSLQTRQEMSHRRYELPFNVLSVTAAGRGFVIRVQWEEPRSWFSWPGKDIFESFFGLKQRLEDLQSLFNEVEKPPFPSPPSPRSVGDAGWRRVIADWGCRGSKRILLFDSLLNLVCLCRGIKRSDGTSFQTASKGEMRKVGEVWPQTLLEELTAALVRAERGGELLYTLVSYWFLFPHQMRDDWCLSKELRTVRKRLSV